MNKIVLFGPNSIINWADMGTVMVNLMGHLDWAMWYPDVWINIMLYVSVR
jgi:hypothetical protein